MTIYDLKPAFQNLLRPICRGLAGIGVTANHVTVAAIVLSGLLGGSIALFPTVRWPLWLLPVGLLVRMALNAIDGMLAREHQMQSPLGGILNELGDVISDGMIYLSLAFVPGIPAVWVVVMTTLAVISEMAGVVAVQIGAGRRYDGPMGKSDRAFLIGLLALLLGVGVSPGRWVDYLLIAMTLLLLVTIVNRCRRALAELR
ncbi:MAG: CDP-alcohol phosphatidyltransferase family protein [Acidobacteriota bacterium]|nr:CDP-alcohol phosphatidyltransferase family protein [Acidobacteriota bacterium]MDH3786271.1 CDP-alcohol phosphatidyltransferase family protein [Acidobacteriota bacterium]